MLVRRIRKVARDLLESPLRAMSSSSCLFDIFSVGWYWLWVMTGGAAYLGWSDLHRNMQLINFYFLTETLAFISLRQWMTNVYRSKCPPESSRGDYLLWLAVRWAFDLSDVWDVFYLLCEQHLQCDQSRHSTHGGKSGMLPDSSEKKVISVISYRNSGWLDLKFPRGWNKIYHLIPLPELQG